MKITIQAQGNRYSIYGLESLAQFCATNPVEGGYEILEGDTYVSRSIVRYAESAYRDVGPRWDKVVDAAMALSDEEML